MSQVEVRIRKERELTSCDSSHLKQEIPRSELLYVNYHVECVKSILFFVYFFCNTNSAFDIVGDHEPCLLL